VVYDIRAAVKVLGSLPLFHTHNAQDSRIREWPAKKYRRSLKPFVVWLEMLNARVDAVTSDIVRHAFN